MWQPILRAFLFHHSQRIYFLCQDFPFNSCFEDYLCGLLLNWISLIHINVTVLNICITKMRQNHTVLYIPWNWLWTRILYNEKLWLYPNVSLFLEIEVVATTYFPHHSSCEAVCVNTLFERLTNNICTVCPVLYCMSYAPCYQVPTLSPLKWSLNHDATIFYTKIFILVLSVQCT